MARILVIDDQLAIRVVLKRLLTHAGHEVLDAFDGQDGMEIFRESPTDMVVTDIQMPRKGGLDVILELRRDFPEVKIIALTAYGFGPLTRATETGAHHAFMKPFSTVELLRVVQELLGTP